MYSRSRLPPWQGSFRPLLIGLAVGGVLLIALVWGAWQMWMPPNPPFATCRTAPQVPPAMPSLPVQFATDFAAMPAGLASTDLPRARYRLDHHAYLIDNQQPHSTARSLLPTPYRPTAITVTATLVAGSPDTASGIIFGSQPDTRHYHLVLSHNGLYRLDYVTPNAITAVLDWTPLPTMQQWQAQPLPRHARIEARLRAAVLELYVDDLLLERLTLSEPLSGQIGLAVTTFGAGGAVCFDNLVIE